jgi:Flp pilus assembly protein TadD
VASYGYSSALFSIAERDLTDGKAGVAFVSVERAIQSCTKSSGKFGCQFKLLGDLYSLGAAFPPNVFSLESDDSKEVIVESIREQQRFVAKGEAAYRQFIGSNPLSSLGKEESLALQSSILCDIAANILLQAQVLSTLRGDVLLRSQENIVQEVDDLYNRAASEFREAIKKNPLHASSWCGLGCAVIDKDPLLAQHAFCRCLQLEKMSPDTYANMGFLYTSRMAFNASRSIMEALTQVADSPMMWMNCAFILEREATNRLKESNNEIQEDIDKAADAYRASLQVLRHPEALLGLSLTCRAGTTNENSKHHLQGSGRKDSLSLLKEYTGVSASRVRVVSAVQGVMCIEKGLCGPVDSTWRASVAEAGKAALESSLEDEGCLSNSLNVALLQKVNHHALIPSKVKSTTSPSPSTSSTLQKRILVEPHRAELWLALAKESTAANHVTVASEAASRATTMLSKELRNEFGRSAVVNSRMISDAIALDVWLKEIKYPGGFGDSTSFDLQRALFMNPANAVARKALNK